MASSSIEDSCTLPLIELENSSSPPKLSAMRSEGTMLDPFSPMRTLDYAQTSDTLTPAEIQLFEDKEGFSKLCRSTPLNKSDSMKKILSKSETNLIKLKDKDHKKQKKKVL